MQRLVHNNIIYKGSILFLSMMTVWSLLFFCLACSSRSDGSGVDELNRRSYAYRYKNLEQTKLFALKALRFAEDINYSEGRAEALVNQAFCEIATLNYEKADSILSVADSLSETPVLHLIIEVQKMRLCQRRALNKEFYFHKTAADNLISEIRKRKQEDSPRLKRLYTYALSEYRIVLSAYLYYVNLQEESSEVLLGIAEDKDIFLLNDTAQYLGLLYNIGAGGILVKGTDEERFFKEFDCLMQCYMIAQHAGYKYWEANSLQALSEHLSDPHDLALIREHDAPCLRYLNDDAVDDTLLAGNLAERSLQVFQSYGDLYQIASAWRTLSQSYHRIGDHKAQLSCLLNSMENILIYQAPDLVASIDENLSIAYSALNDKMASDYYRNQYLDIQDSTRQDRQLEARAEALSDLITHTQWLIFLVVVVLIVLVFVVIFLIYKRKHHSYSAVIEKLANILTAWKDRKKAEMDHLEEEIEELDEQKQMLLLQQDNALRVNVEQHAKVAYTQNILPLIDRMLHAVSTDRAKTDKDGIEYVSDICESILKYNSNLTSWVQLRKGQVALHIEKFSLNDLFDIIRLNNKSYSAKGVQLSVDETDIVVKADKVLTLFLVNTIADNARKFTPSGGSVTISAKESADVPDYAEISITDTGEGMDSEACSNLFAYKPINDGEENLTEQKSHGFGLMNCRGIIDRYRKTSEFFSRCSISAESEKGRGTRIFFTIPMVKSILVCIFMLFSASLSDSCYAASTNSKVKLNEYADSVYACNVSGRYEAAIIYADSCLQVLNRQYLQYNKANPNDTLSVSYNEADLRWQELKVPIDYEILIFLRNEIAVASLALNNWDLYENNNRAYTKLYKQCTRDTTLSTYCATMEKTEQTNNIFVAVLIVLFMLLAFVFWWFYVRDVLSHRRSLSSIRKILSMMSQADSEQSALQQLTDERISQFSTEMQDVAKGIRSAIEESVSQENSLRSDISSLKDEISLIQRECEKLYISNSIIDNTLSALKHETMYYPARINVLVKEYLADDSADSGERFQEIHDIISYYRSVYAMLSQQANRGSMDAIMINRIKVEELKFHFLTDLEVVEQDSRRILASKPLMDFLCFLLKKRNDKEAALVTGVEIRDQYILLDVECSNVNMTSAEVSELFTLSSRDFDFLIIRQILREIGGQTNNFATGIIAVSPESEASSPLLLRITLPFK